MVTRRPPSRISQGFRSTMAQGQWAEGKAIETINNHKLLRGIRYGQSRIDFKNKGEFIQYWEKMHTQIKTFGKRPDVLVFIKKDAIEYPDDLSELDEKEIMDKVKKSMAGLECRSSTWIVEKYKEAMKDKGKELSFTVKEEDLEVVERWIKTYHKTKMFYVQFFFDGAFVISFERIQHLLKNGKKGEDYTFRVDRETEKKTYRIPISRGVKFADCAEMPTLDCDTLVDEIGQVMAIRTPKGGKYVLSDEFIKELLP